MECCWSNCTNEAEVMLFGNTSGMCRECWKSWTHELAMHNEIMFGTDSKGERWLDKIPEDPSRN